MKTYNRYKHCGETFYTGTNIEQIVCSECETQITFDDIIQTKNAISNISGEIEPAKVFESEEEL